MQITYSVPYSVTAEVTADSGGGQGIYHRSSLNGPYTYPFLFCLEISSAGLAIGVLNLAIVIPQVMVYWLVGELAIMLPFIISSAGLIGFPPLHSSFGTEM